MTHLQTVIARVVDTFFFPYFKNVVLFFCYFYLLLFADESQEVDVVIVMSANVGQDAQVTSS